MRLDGREGEAVREAAGVVKELSDQDPSPLGTPLIHLEMWSYKEILPSPTSCRMRVAVNVLVWLAILNCMSVFSGCRVAKLATPAAVTNVPLGLQMPIRTPGCGSCRETAGRSVAPGPASTAEEDHSRQAEWPAKQR